MPRQKLALRFDALTNRWRKKRVAASIFISDLLQASGLSWQELRGWIEKEVVEAGHGQLDEGDWNAATRNSEPLRSIFGDANDSISLCHELRHSRTYG